MDDVYLIRAQGLPWSCTIEDVVNFFSGIFYVCLKYVILSEFFTQTGSLTKPKLSYAIDVLFDIWELPSSDWFHIIPSNTMCTICGICQV